MPGITVEMMRVAHLKIGNDVHTVEWHLGDQEAACTCESKRHTVGEDGRVIFLFVPCPNDGGCHATGYLSADGTYKAEPTNCWY